MLQRAYQTQSMRFSMIALFFLLLLFTVSTSRTEQIDVEKQHFFDHSRIQSYITELENRYQVKKESLEVAEQMYKAYFLAERFTSAEAVIRHAISLAKVQKKREKVLVGLKKDLIKTLFYSYQFGVAVQEINNFLTDHGKNFEEDAYALESMRERARLSSKLPRKKSDDSDTGYLFQPLFTANLTALFEIVRFHQDGRQILIKRKKDWFFAQLPVQWWSSNKPVQYTKYNSSEQPEFVLQKPTFGFGKDRLFIEQSGNLYLHEKLPFEEVIAANQSKEKNKKKKKAVDRSWEKTALFKDQGSLSCKDYYIAPEDYFLFASCSGAATEVNGLKSYDIFFAYKTGKGSWSKLERMTFSSDGDDVNPVVTPDGRYLLFSSNGHPGYGGFDLFFVRLKFHLDPKLSSSAIPLFDKKMPTKARNLGPKYNTFRDEKGDIGFSNDRKSLLAYRYTHKNGFGIYSALLPGFMYYAPMRAFMLAVSDQDTRKPIQAQVSLIPRSSASLWGKRTIPFASGGKYFALADGGQYYIKTRAKGYFYHFDYLDENQVGSYLDIPMKRIKLGGTLNAKGILFNSNSAILKQEAKEALEAIAELLEDNPTIRISLEGHTSHAGANQAAIMQESMRLSEDRALAVRDYLIQHGIYPRRLQVKGFGPTQPLPGIAPEDSSNRRTEIRVVDLKWDTKKEIVPTIVFGDFFETNPEPIVPFLQEAIPNSVNTSLRDLGFLYKKIDRAKWVHNVNELKEKSYAKFGNRVGADIIVFGEYKSVGLEIVITPKVYIVDKDKILTMDPFTTMNGPGMFGDLDALAKKIEEFLYQNMNLVRKDGK